jgi:hypothetical protein
MDLHRPTGAWYFRRLHQARAFTIGIILKFELLSVRFQTKAFTAAEQPFRRFVLPPLAGADRVSNKVLVRRIDANVVMVAGSSSFPSATHAQLWRFTGSVIESIDVHAELVAAKATLGLDNVAVSNAVLLNHNGQAAGMAVGFSSAVSSEVMVAWFRENNGTIRKLGVIATGTEHINAEPEMKSLADDGWVLTDTLTAGASDIAGTLYGTIPPYHAMAYHWNGSSTEAVDLHAELAVAAGLNVANFVSGPQFNRSGAGAALGVSCGTVSIGNDFRPWVRAANGDYVISDSNQGLGGDVNLKRINAAGDMVMVASYDAVSDADSAYVASWDGTGLMPSPGAFPNLFGVLTKSQAVTDSFEVNTTDLANLIHASTGDGQAYRSYIQPTMATSPFFGPAVFPEWKMPSNQARSHAGDMYDNFEVNALDGAGTDRVYVGDAHYYSAAVSNQANDVVLLVDESKITTLASLATASFAWPAAGSQLPADHAFPAGIAVAGLPIGATISRVDYQVALPGLGSLNRTLNPGDVYGPAWRTDFISGSTIGSATATATITYGDGSVDSTNVSFAIVAAPSVQFGLVKLPRPVGYDDGRVESLSSNGAFAAGSCNDFSQPKQAAIWSNLAATPAVALIDASSVIPDTLERSWIRCVNDSGDVVGFALSNKRGSLYDVHAWARRDGTFYYLGKIKSDYDESAPHSDTFDWFSFSNSGVIGGQKAGLDDLSLPFIWTWNGSGYTETAVLSAILSGTGAAMDGASVEAMSPDGLSYGGGYGLQAGTVYSAYVQRTAGDWDIPGLPSATGDSFWTVDITNGGDLAIEGEDAGKHKRSFVQLGATLAEIMPLRSGGSVQMDELNDQGTAVGRQQYFDFDVGGDLSAACIKTAAGTLTPLTWLVSATELDLAAGSANDQWQANLWEAAGISDGANAVIVANGDDGPYFLRGGNQPPTMVINGAGSGLAGETLNWTVAVADDSTAAASLTLVAQATSDASRVALNDVVVSGSGAARTVAVAILPAAPNGTVDITLRVSDGTATRDVTKTVTIGMVAPTAGIAVTDPVNEDSDQSGAFTVTLSSPAPVGGVTVSYAVSGSATPGNDFNALSGTVFIAESTTSALLNVSLIADSLPEEAEDIVVTLQGAAGYTVGGAAVATMMIPRSDVNYWVFWIANRHLNDQPTGQTNLVWWMTTVRPVASAVFKIPGKADIAAWIEDGGTRVTFPHDKIFADGDISLADLDAYLPVSPDMNTLDYQCVISYQDTTTETRRGSYLGFDPAGTWPAMPQFTAPIHGGTTALNALRMTVAWTNPINWVGLSARNGRSPNRDYWESANAPTSPLVLPIDLADDQTYFLELKSPGDHSLGRSDNPQYGGIYDVSLASMNSVLVQTGSTPAIGTYDSSSADLTGTIFGALPDGSVTGTEDRNQAAHALTVTISTEPMAIPGTVTQVQAKKLHRQWNDGSYEQTLWLAKNTAGEVHVIKATRRQGPLMTVPAGQGEMLLLVPADPAIPWYLGDQGATSRTSINANAPSANVSGCQQLTINWGNDGDVIYIKPGMGIVEWSFIDGSATRIGGWYVNPPGGNIPPVIAEGASADLAATEDAGAVVLTLNGGDAETSAAALLWSVANQGTKGVASLSSSLGGSTTLTYTPNANAFGADDVTVFLTDGDGAIDSIVIHVGIAAVNDAPSFIKGADQTVAEDAGVQNVTNWATAISAGLGEFEPVTFSITANSNISLFAGAPTIAPNGRLSYAAAPNQSGSATIQVTLSDGALTDVQTFVITVMAVNDAPSFVAGPNRVVDLGAVFSAPWATAISAGPGEADQVVSFAVVASNPSMFTVQPTISSTGVLSFTAAVSGGSSDLSITLSDNGGTASGGVNVSATVVRTISLQGAPLITSQPVTVLTQVGATATFTVVANGTPSPTFLWQRSNDNGVTWTAIDGAISATYTTPVLVDGDHGARFRCIASNTAGSATSMPAAVNLGVPASITAQPLDVSVGLGAIANFAVGSVGSPAPTRQWQRSIDGGTTWLDLPGATGANLSIGPVTLAHHGNKYRCRIANPLANSDSFAATLTVMTVAPTISQNPQSRNVVAPASASFNVIAFSNPAPNFQWQRMPLNGAFTDIDGATSPSYTTPGTSVAGNHGDAYRCVVSNAGGSVISTTATLTVEASAIAPSSLSIAGPTNVVVGQTISLSAVLGTMGTPTPLIQWTRNGLPIAQGPTFTLKATLADHGASIGCRATNSAGSATATAIVLQVSGLAPTCSLVVQPGPTITAGATVTVIANVTGQPAPTLQWQKDGVDIVGATGPSLQSTPAATAVYSCVATNSAGSSTGTTTVTVNVTSAPLFVTHPANTTPVGNLATFSVVVSGTPTPTLQWMKGATIVAGATKATLVLAVASGDDGASITCVATSSAGTATSNAAILSVPANLPVITSQPASLTVADGTSATFTVVATGTTLTYQWERSLDQGVSWSDVSDAISNTLTITADAAANQGARFRCAVTGGGTVRSASAVLNVLAAPVFTTQPLSLSVALDAVAVFSVQATANPTFQWQRRDSGGTWSNVVGATKRHFAFKATVDDHLDEVRCLATVTGFAAVTSDAAVVTVQMNAPVFTTQPLAAVVAVGGIHSLIVEVSGTPSGVLNRPALQWESSVDGTTWTSINEATATSLVVSTNSTGETVYRCLASNLAGMTISDAVLVQVMAEAPFIITEPLSASTNPGLTASFDVVAGGTATLSYQWQRSDDAGTTWNDVASATTASLTTAALTVANDNGDLYRCRVTNVSGDVVSSSAALTVQTAASAPTVTGVASSTTVNAAATLSLTATVAGVPTPTIQWFAGNDAIPGATTAQLEVANVSYAWNGLVIGCRATNSAGTVTGSTTLTVTVAVPVIDEQPIAVTTPAGKPFSLSCAATGMAGATLSYQWERQAPGSTSYAAVSGATSATLTRNRGSFGQHAGLWRCVVGYADVSGVTVTTIAVSVQVNLTMFPIIGQLYDTVAGTAIDPTPGAFGLGDEGLVRWDGLAAVYVPVPTDEALVVGGAYFLSGSATPVLQAGLTLLPPPSAPPLVLVWGSAAAPKWNLVTVSLDDLLYVPGLGELTPAALADQTLYIRAVWLIDPISGTTIRIGDPTRFIGAISGPIPAGSTLWIQTLDQPPVGPG